MTAIIRSARPSPAEAVAVESAELFRALDREVLSRIRPLLRERRFARQETLFREGSAASDLWVLERGGVRLYKTSADGEVTTLETLGPGQVFGVISALDEPTYPASAEALTDGLARRLPVAAFVRLLEEEPRAGLEVLRIVSGRLREAQERVRAFAQDPARARLAAALLRTARAGEARITRRALAEAAGTTVETAIRVLRRFEREGLIHGEVGRIGVHDEPALRRIAGAGT